MTLFTRSFLLILMYSYKFLLLRFLIKSCPYYCVVLDFYLGFLRLALPLA